MAGRKVLDKTALLVASLAREHTETAIKTLADLMLNAEENAVRKAAADSLLDRGWGKPAQAINHGDAEGKNLPPPNYMMMVNGVEKK